MNNYARLITARGYYCNMCDTYHDQSETLHRYTVETLGEWCGQPATIKHEETLCPNCYHGADDLETFDAYAWTHLRAYREATDTPMTFVYPLFDRATDGETYGFDSTTSADELEEIADNYCIEVLNIEEQNGEIVVTVDFQ